ncbi:MAG: hypothetical protein COA94_00820 [Rickettsiales bacterium]|nr:MAG: hypothetical protein COA94_00820 [Rickettsiales bacterium]
MSKDNSENAIDTPSIFDVAIERRALSLSEIQAFSEFAQSLRDKNSDASISLAKYVRETFFKGQNIVVVPDLTGLELEDLNLKNVDFSGSVIRNTRFTRCDLTDSVFCDTDLNGAFFDSTKLKNIDFRGANLVNCEFGESYGHLAPSEMDEFSSGIKFSITADLGRRYADIKSNNHRLLERQNLRAAKQGEIDRAYSELTFVQRVRSLSNASTGYDYYDNLTAELANMQKGLYPKEYIMHESFQRVFGSQGSYFDPCYMRGSGATERGQEKRYIRTDRAEMEAYLAELKSNPKLILNDFVRQRHNAAYPNEMIDDAVIVHADCSSRVGLDNEWILADFSGLNFTGANLQSVNFAGANFTGENSEGTVFTKANISNSSFEGAILDNAQFIDTTAIDANFFDADIAAEITGSDFTRAYMANSRAHTPNFGDAEVASGTGANAGVRIKESIFNFADISNANWDGITIEDSTFNYANLEGVSLASATIRQTKMQHANLSRAILKEATLIEVDLENARLEQVNAFKVTIQKSVLRNISAREINLSEADLDEFCTLDGADLTQAIMKKAKADKVSFINAQMSGIQASEASFQGANFQNAQLRFAQMQEAKLNDAKAHNVDMTGADLTYIEAQRADFANANLEAIQASRANLTDAVMEGADIRAACFRNALLERVNLHKAKINPLTDISNSNIDGASGTLETEEGENISIKDKKTQDDLVHSAKETGMFRRVAGGLLSVVAWGAKKAAPYMRQIFSSKTGKIAGAIILGAALAVGAGWGLAAIGAATGIIVGGAAIAGLVGAGIGWKSGNKAAQNFGITGAIATGFGAYYGGAPGAAMAATASVAANVIVRGAVGRSIDEGIGDGVEYAANRLDDLSSNIGLSREQQLALKAHQQAEMHYIHPQEIDSPVRSSAQGSLWRDQYNNERIKQAARSKQASPSASPPPPHSDSAKSAEAESSSGQGAAANAESQPKSQPQPQEPPLAKASKKVSHVERTAKKEVDKKESKISRNTG